MSHLKLNPSGRGRFFYNGQVLHATWAKSGHLADYEWLVTFANGETAVISDSYEELGFVYLAPDSGDQMQFIMVPLNDNEPDPVNIPTQAQISAAAFAAMKPIMDSVAAGETDPADLNFCRQLDTRINWLSNVALRGVKAVSASSSA